MKYETEMMVRAMLSVDSSVTESQTNDAIEILRYGFDPTRGLIHVMKIREVAKSLGVCDATVHWYARIGLLDKVVGGGGRFRFGIAQDSFFRFVRDRSRKMTAEREAKKPKQPEWKRPPRRAIERDIKFRKARWALRGFKNASRHEKYAAAKDYLKTHPDVSHAIACEALGFTAGAFYSYWKHHPATEARISEFHKKVLSATHWLHPDKSVPIAIYPLLKSLRKRDIVVSFRTLKALLAKENYKWRRCKRRPPTEHVNQAVDQTPWYHDEDFIEIS